jgi:hypothetical protein
VAAASGASSNVYAVEKQYYDTTGPIAYSSTFGGSVTDTTLFRRTHTNRAAGRRSA